MSRRLRRIGLVLGVLVVALVGLVVVALVLAAVRGNDGGGTAPSTTTASGPPTTSSGTAFSMIKPFDPEISFNRPVGEFGRSERYEPYVERFWKYSSFGGWTDPSLRGKLFLEMRNYSTPIYDAREATGTKRAFFANFGYPPSPGYSINVPWNDNWKTAPGSDAILMAANPDNGELHVIWAYQGANPTTCLNLSNLAAGFRPFEDLCVGGATRLENEDGSIGDYRTWNSVQESRGMGIPKLALITTPYEVQNGAIEHALEMTVFNTMFGPPCSAAEMDTSAAGASCGFYLPPATRIEWFGNAPTDCGANNQPSDATYRRKTVPEGMRFALDVNDAEIEAWLDSRNYVDPLRRTARIFAVALRDYGFIIAETGCYGSSIEVDGMVNPEARKIWLELGIEDTPEAGNLLDGLVTEDRLYVVNPPDPVPSVNPPKPGRGGR